MANRLALLGVLRMYMAPKILRSVSYRCAVKMSTTCKSLHASVRAAVKERAAAFEAEPSEFVEAYALEAEEIVEYLRRMDKGTMARIMEDVRLDDQDCDMYTAVIQTMIRIDVALAASAVYWLPEDLDRTVFWDLRKQEQLDLIAAMDNVGRVACWFECCEESDDEDEHSEVFRSLPVKVGAAILCELDAESASQMLLSCGRPRREEYFRHMEAESIAQIFEDFEQLVDYEPEECWTEFFSLLPVALTAAVLQHCTPLPAFVFVRCADAGYLVDLLGKVDAPIAANIILEDVAYAQTHAAGILQRGAEGNTEQGRRAIHQRMRVDVPLVFRQAGPGKAAFILQALLDDAEGAPLAAQFLERMRDGALIAGILSRLDAPIASRLLDLMRDVGLTQDVIGALGEEQAGRLVACRLSTRGLPGVLFLMQPRAAAAVLGAMLPDEALRLSNACEHTKPWLRILNAMDWHCLMCLLKCMGAQKACSTLSKLDAEAGARLLSGVELADAVWMVSAVSGASSHACSEAWGLASVLGSMAPALAGRILSGTRDSEQVAGLCCKMRPGAAAAILSGMDNAVFAHNVRMRM